MLARLKGLCSKGLCSKTTCNRGGARIFPTGGGIFDEGAKMQLIGYYKWQKSRRKIAFNLPTGG